jgi:hypothetical protein
MKDGSYFATSYIVACFKALENETNEDCNNHHTERSCTCAYLAGWLPRRALALTKDRPAKHVHSSGPRLILSKTKANQVGTEPYQWFDNLYALCMDALKENADHLLAQEFLQKLETCHDFFCGALEHLVRMTRSLPSVPKEEIGEQLLLL